MAQVNLVELLKALSQKTGVEIPDSSIEKVKALDILIEEETEGDSETKINSLMSREDAEADPQIKEAIKKAVQAETWNGLKKHTLDVEANSLDVEARKIYDAKKSESERIKFLLSHFKSKGANADDYQALQAKVEEYEQKIERGEIVEATVVNEYKTKLSTMQKNGFVGKVGSKIKGIANISKSLTDDEDFDTIVSTKLESFAKKKGWSIDYENGQFLDGTGQVVKVKAKDPFSVDDFVKEFETNNQHLIVKSNPAKTGDVTIDTGDVIIDANPNQKSMDMILDM